MQEIIGISNFEAAARPLRKLGRAARCPTVWVALLGLAVTQASAQVQFEDVSVSAGVDYTGESYGVSVGYANNDALPDIFVNHHRARTSLLVNLGNGTFQDREFEVDAWQTTPRSDMHGGTFADFDNDGDFDLMISAGAKNYSQFLVNNGEFLSDKVVNYTFDRLQWGGRLPVWFDFTRDGRLDFGMTVQGNLIQMFEQSDTDFERANFLTQHECDNNDYALLSDMNFDNALDLVCINQGAFPEKIYDVSGPYPFVDISSQSESHANVIDAFAADLDGDLVQEYFGLRGRIRVNGAEQTDADSIEAHLIDQNGRFSTLTFQSAGDVSFEIHWNARNAANVHIGAADNPAQSADEGEPLRVNLSPADPEVHGMPPFDPGVDDGIFIGYNPATQTWTMIHASGDRNRNSYTYTYIDSSLPISNMILQGLLALDTPREPLLLNYRPSLGRYVHEIAGTGLQTPVKCVSTVAADFDNDMDLDIFMACRDGVSNLANRLYLNDGTGQFTLATGSWGATGPVGFGVGLSENVVTTDYDVDGFVDLYVTNGLKLFPEEPYVAGGPDKLFRNLGNGNNWIELDLEGTVSNRDAIGAIVTLTAGGIAQRREQNGGYKRWAQNDRRMHFGLAGNGSANIEVRWPSGAVNSFNAVGANGVYRLVEGSSNPEPVTIPSTVPPSVCERTVGAPTINTSTDAELFIWQDACGAPWQFRFSGGGQAPSQDTGKVRTDKPIASVTRVLLEADDVLTLDSAGTELDYRLTVGGASADGFILGTVDNTSVCAGIDASRPSALIGPDRIRVNLPVNLRTLQSCTVVTPRVSIADGSAIESAASGTLTIELTMDLEVPYVVSVDYTTTDGTATSPDDYTTTSGTATFEPLQTTATIEIPIVDDSEVEFSETFRVLFSNPVSATLQQSFATATIYDDDPGSCGAPTIDTAIDRGLFIWEDCASGTWTVTASAGGVNRTYIGRVQADAAIPSVTPDSIEANDVLDFVTDPALIDFSLVVGNSGYDGFSFTLAAGSSACFDLDSPATPVFVGAQRNPMAAPFDLTTLGTCFPAMANLITTVQQSSGSPRPRVGSAVDFDIVVFNEGSSIADVVTLLAALPAGLELVTHTVTSGSYDPGTGTWDIGSMGVGATATLTISATVDNGQDGRKITFAVSAASGTPSDPTTEGDRLQALLSILPRQVPVSNGSGGASFGITPVIFDRVRFATDFVLIQWLSPGGSAGDGVDIRPDPATGSPGAGTAGPRPVGPGVAGLRLRERQGALNIRAEEVWSPGGNGATESIVIPPASSEFTISWTVSPSTSVGDWTASVLRDDSVSGLEYSRGLLYVRQAGQRIAEVGALSTGDVVSIAVKGSRIEYMRNERIVSVGSLAETGAFRFDTMVADDTKRFDDLRLLVP